MPFALRCVAGRRHTGNYRLSAAPVLPGIATRANKWPTNRDVMNKKTGRDGDGDGAREEEETGDTPDRRICRGAVRSHGRAGCSPACVWEVRLYTEEYRAELGV